MPRADGIVPLPDVEGVRHRYVYVDGVRFHVAEAGPQDGPPVVLLHGWPQHWYAWRSIIPILAAAGRHVVCPDLRGMGWSDAPPGPYLKATLADDMLGVLDALALGRVDLIAHDWGAWIGFLLCLDHPDRVAHFVPLNISTPWLEPPSLDGAIVAARLWYQVVLAAPVLGAGLLRRTKLVERMITTGAAHPEAWGHGEAAVFADVLRQPMRAAASTRLYRTFLTREVPPLVRGAFDDRRLTVPTRLLFGTRDVAIDHRHLGAWPEHADDMTVELRDDAGHFIPEELPEFVAERALALFDGTG